MHNNSMIKYLAIFILWIVGMGVCVAQCGGLCADCNEPGDECFCDIQDPDLYPTAPGFIGPLPGGPVCLNPNGFGYSYCILAPGTGVVIPGTNQGGCTYVSYTRFPLSDASFLLIFLLGIYGFFIYRRRVALNRDK